MVGTAVVSTSINPAPEAYIEWARQADTLIIAGDKNSPADLQHFVEELGGVYLTPEEQNRRWEFSPLIGWNCIMRRNAAIMTAYAEGFDTVVTVDDDNHPEPDFVERHVSFLRPNTPRPPLATHPSLWINTGEFVFPPTRQRGTPYGIGVGVVNNQPPRRDADPVQLHNVEVLGHVVVSQGQILGDPDCDAITRLINPVDVDHVVTDVMIEPAIGYWAAFNSQATVWRGDWAPLMVCLPHVGRYDDIFSAFIAETAMAVRGGLLRVGAPTVQHKRNPHDTIRDLADEAFGLDVTLNVTGALGRMIGEILTSDLSLLAIYQLITRSLNALRLLPSQTIRFMEAWLSEWKKIDARRDR